MYVVHCIYAGLSCIGADKQIDYFDIPEMYTRRKLNTMYRRVSLKDPLFRLLPKVFQPSF